MNNLLSLNEAAGLLPRRKGKKISLCTLWRWSQAGIKGVRLQTVPVGHQLFTTAEWLQEFIDRLADIRRRRYSRDSPEHRAARDICRQGRPSAQLTASNRFLRAEGLIE